MHQTRFPRLLVASLVAVLSLGTLWAEDEPETPPETPPGPTIDVGPSTTRVLGPLDADGYVDYIAALNLELGKGINRDENAAVLILQSMGICERNPHVTNLIRKELGLPEWKPGDLDFITISEFAAEISQEAADSMVRGQRSQQILDQNTAAMERPWVNADFPEMSALLDRNAESLKLLRTGVLRPKYFRPYARMNADDMLMAILLPDIQETRDFARQLSMRAMRHLGHGRVAEARDDIQTMHRLGSHISAGGTLIEGLVGVAIDSIATMAGNRWAAHPLTTPQEIAAYRAALQTIPVPGHFTRQLDTAERFMGLDTCQTLARGRVSRAKLLGTDDYGLFGPNDKNALIRPDQLFEAFVGLSVDWNTTMETMNRQYDTLVQIVKAADPRERDRQLAALDLTLKAQRAETATVKTLVTNVLGGSKYRGSTVGKTLGQLLLPAVTQVFEADNRLKMRRQTAIAGLAALEYKAATGQFPAELSDLVPKYLPALPVDLYTGEALHWKSTEAGFRIYSVGRNRQDDGGRTFQPMSPADDIRFAIPVPADTE